MEALLKTRIKRKIIFTLFEKRKTSLARTQNRIEAIDTQRGVRMMEFPFGVLFFPLIIN